MIAKSVESNIHLQVSNNLEFLNFFSEEVCCARTYHLFSGCQFHFQLRPRQHLSYGVHQWGLPFDLVGRLDPLRKSFSPVLAFQWAVQNRKMFNFIARVN